MFLKSKSTGNIFLKRHHSADSDDRLVEAPVEESTHGSSNCFRRTLFFIQKRVKRALVVHGVEWYSPSVAQSAWSPHPTNLSVASSLWIDLTIVGVIYRLDEFYLIASRVSLSGFWVPYALFLTIYDAWESRVILQAEFKTRGISIAHSVAFFASWLLLALMGTTLPYQVPSDVVANFSADDGYSYDYFWEPLDLAVFTYMKLFHAVLRVLQYLEVYLFSPQEKARNSAVMTAQTV